MIANTYKIKSTDENIPYELMFSADGKYLIGLEQEDEHICILKVWDIADQNLVFAVTLNYKPYKVGISADGKYIAFLKYGLNSKLELPSGMYSLLAIQNCGHLIGDAEMGREDTDIYQLATGEKVNTIPDPEENIRAPSGEKIRLQSFNHFDSVKGENEGLNDQYSFILKDAEMEIIGGFKLAPMHTVHFAFDWFVDHETLPIWAGYSKDKGLIVLKLNSRHDLNPAISFDQDGHYRIMSQYPNCIKLHPQFGHGDGDMDYLAVTYGSTFIIIYHWSGTSLEKVAQLLPGSPKSKTECLCFSWGSKPSDKQTSIFVVAGYLDQQLRLYNCNTLSGLIYPEKEFNGTGHIAPVTAVLVDEYEDYIFSIGRDKTIRKWHITTGEESEKFSCPKLEKQSHSLLSGPDNTIVSLSRSSLNQEYDENINSLSRWSAVTGQHIQTYSFGFPGWDRRYNPEPVAFTNDSFIILMGRANDGGYETLFSEYDTATKKITVLPCKEHIKSIAMSRYYNHIYSYGADKARVEWGDARDYWGERSHLHPQEVACLAMAPDNNLVFQGSKDSSLSVINVEARDSLAEIQLAKEGYFSSIQAMTFTPDNSRLILLLPFDSIVYWHMANLQVDLRIKAKGLDSENIGVSPDNSTLLLTGGMVPLRKWPMKSRNEDQSYAKSFSGKGGYHNLTHLFISPDNRVIISARLRGEKRLHFSEFSTGNKICEWDNESDIGIVAISPDGRHIIFGTTPSYKNKKQQAEIFILEINTQTVSLESIEVIEIEEDEDTVTGITISPDGRHIFAVIDEEYIYIWNIFSMKLARKHFLDNGDPCDTYFYPDDSSFKYIYCLIISPDGKYLFLGGQNTMDEPVVDMYDIRTAELIHSFSDAGLNHFNRCLDDEEYYEPSLYEEGDRWIEKIAISPDGKFLVSYADSDENDNRLFIWSLEEILGDDYIQNIGPLIVTATWYPSESLAYMRQTAQGIISDTEPLVRCGACGKISPVSKEQLGEVISCPHGDCGRELRLNDFIAGTCVGKSG